MNVKELIVKLKELPQDLPIRAMNYDDIERENEWVVEIEHSDTGESGYECCGEVRLLTSE
tara:strand:+ start:35989 stop:36168 length:180 start_codon:yes stop_codon:yes gene_type:complete